MLDTGGDGRLSAEDIAVERRAHRNAQQPATCMLALTH